MLNPTQVSQEVGYIVEEFKCSHNNFQGLLYAGPLAVVFLGRMLLFEWTVVIKWEDVVKVQKCSERGMEHGIRIDTQGPNANKYYFERFFDSSKALGVLVSLHNDSILDLSQKIAPTPKCLSRVLRRNNSDPLRISNFFNFDNDTLAIQNNEMLQSLIAKNRILNLSASREEDFGAVSPLSVASAPVRKRDILKRSSTYNYSADSTKILQIQTGKEIEDPTRVDVKELERKETMKLTPAELQAEWMAFLNDNDSYSEVVVENMELSCDLETFIQIFVANDAMCPMSKFMAQRGDKDVTVSDWKENVEGSMKVNTRTIEYTHPVDAPMAPPMARARKEQSYKLYGEHGLVVATKTYVADVPLTDCFYVADVLLVENKSAEGNGGDIQKNVSVSILFDIRFVKPTMFKSIITRTTKSELENFFSAMSTFFTTCLGESKGVTAVLAPVAPIAPIVLPTTTSRWSQFGVQMSIIVFLLQLYTLFEMRGLKMQLQRLASCRQFSVEETHHEEL